MPEISDKPKIKLSELTEMYDIENDGMEVETLPNNTGRRIEDSVGAADLTDESSFEDTITYYDSKLSEAVDKDKKEDGV